MSRLTGRVAIVTGAAQGIGAVFAKALAQAGASVVVSDVVDPGPVAEHVNAAGGQAIAMAADVTQPKSVRKMVDMVNNTWGHVDILINNAPLFGTLRHCGVTEWAHRWCCTMSLRRAPLSL